MTLLILCGFAGAIGALTTQRIEEDFNRRVGLAADRLQLRLTVRGDTTTQPSLTDSSIGADAIRVVDASGEWLRKYPDWAPDFGAPRERAVEAKGYRVESRELYFNDYTSQPLYFQLALSTTDVESTIQRVRLFLVLGVLSGAALALVAGLTIARRAMDPITQLTAAAREIGRTRDPAQRVPTPEANDEVAELARTLDGMLTALDDARSETEAALQRQREFVADASHELRTPLTSVLANLELLADSLDGERGEAARSALRSSWRMRRLVADLLLLARADARRQAPHAPTDLGEVMLEAAGELGAVASGHDLSVDAQPAVVDGARDELHRLALNLMENALRHTPPGTQVRAGVHRENGRVELVVEDDGPGIPDSLGDRVFERFVRGEGDRGGSFGLGLSIVRAVAESHGGRVDVVSPTLRRPAHGTRFVVTLPAAHG
ncbi:MAG: HAMP domain-containing histidine kinase [Solirubrobacterales bacterium]|nr:HAMP domain-containing histidine kinase [Solirubrobacterales bacterium]